MKSSPDKLKERGKIDKEELYQLTSLSKEELIQHMQMTPSIRSACIRLLSSQFHNDDDYTQILLNQLIKETSLYTKIEIQDQLSLYGDVALMCQYLGKIGNNQYRKLPQRVSLKKSYPLPRDIIARSIAHMNISYFSDFVDIIPHLSTKQLQEAIDALGFLCFYHNELATSNIEEMIYQLINQYHDNDLIVWKLITCLSAFPNSFSFLTRLKETQKHPTILMEVERSIKLITH